MREVSYQQYAIVEADSASILTDRLNQRLKELKDKDPVVEFDGLRARIKYVERFDLPEDMSEVFSMNDVRLTCSRCPFFEPTEKQDGSIDKRSKKGKCPCAKYGIAYSDGPVCETLYQMLNRGEIGLCFTESAEL